MSDWIERDGKRYYEESYLLLANRNARRRGEDGMTRFITGERCEIRALDKRDEWIPANVKLASSNGKSLAITCSPESSVARRAREFGGMMLERETHNAVLLLTWTGDAWECVGNPHALFEVRRRSDHQ